MKTDNQTLTASQNAVASYITETFHSGNGPLIMLRQITPGKVNINCLVRSFHVLKATSTRSSRSDADTSSWLSWFSYRFVDRYFHSLWCIVCIVYGVWARKS